ncbi:hypothetical protein M433DRAFT_9520 [Acidomyces richmondensis BFW]|nr:hypothetical protein M433DRAFT_9520 [Acidomyces richmondensis BFW]
MRASWLKSQKAREGKTHSSLILSVQSAQQGKDCLWEMLRRPQDRHLPEHNQQV